MKKKSVPGKSDPKRSRTPDDRRDSGTAGPGKRFDPTAVPETRECDEPAEATRRDAPAPGLPISQKEYERLKEKAKSVAKRSPKSGKKRPVDEQES